MTNIKDLKETPDFMLKNITKDIELTDTELFKELDNITDHKSNAFDLKANEELSGMQSETKSFNSASQDSNLGTDKVQMGTGNTKINLGNMLDAELCTKLIDTLLPSLFVLVLRMGAGVNINKKELQASPRELEAIKPVVQKCLEAIELNINNPFIALGIVLGTIYTTKAADIGFNKYMDKAEGKKKETVLGDAIEREPKKQRAPRSDKGQRRN